MRGMKRLFLLIFLLLAQVVYSSDSKIIGYYPNWAIYRNPSLKPLEINGALMTHINYAFIKVDGAGNLILFDPWSDTDYRSDWNSERPFWGNFHQLNELKKKYPHLKTLFSVGGWTLSDPFSEMAASPQARKNFVTQ
jgi:chitinase